MSIGSSIATGPTMAILKWSYFWGYYWILSIPDKSTLLKFQVLGRPFGPFWSRNVKSRSKWPKWSKGSEIFQFFQNGRNVPKSEISERHPLGIKVFEPGSCSAGQMYVLPSSKLAKVGRISWSTNSNSSSVRAYFLYWDKKIHVFANCYKKEFSGLWEALFCLKLLFDSDECLIFALAISLPIWWRSLYHSTD